MKTNKVTISYGNSASISTGKPYEMLKPFYNISEEIEGEISDSDIESRIQMLKDMVDPFLLQDFENIKPSPSKDNKG